MSGCWAGSVKINTAKLTFEDSITWRGEYYTDYPVTLTAIPADGYRFVRWENIAPMQEAGCSQFLPEEESIEVDLPEDGLSIKAVFEKI